MMLWEGCLGGFESVVTWLFVYTECMGGVVCFCWI